MVSRQATQRNHFRLLLDQGFPNPPGFDITDVDRNLTATHLSHWRPDLSKQRTPDWVLYCEAALGGFNALVTRDFSQAEQAEEMVCLSRLKDFHIVSWKERMDDPITEWGQLLAYLPELRRHLGNNKSKLIFLPRPRLSLGKNIHDPKEFIARIAKSRGESVEEVRHGAKTLILDWEQKVGSDNGRYAALLRY